MTNNAPPPFRGFLVETWTDDAGTEKKTWTEIAAVWPYANGEGFDLAFKGQRKGEGRMVCIVPQRGLPENGPEKTVHLVEEGKDGKKRWTEIGAVWRHKNSPGFDVVLTGGLRIVCVENKPKDAANESESFAEAAGA